jgi:membrane protease YdiL (CAAX protease family)
MANINGENNEEMAIVVGWKRRRNTISMVFIVIFISLLILKASIEEIQARKYLIQRGGM